jgi:hypothetical protein
MSAKRYRKKPVEVEAIFYDGTNFKAMAEFTGFTVWEAEGVGNDYVGIVTMEGKLYFGPGYYVVRGVTGEFYPCHRDIFKRTYEEVQP